MWTRIEIMCLCLKNRLSRRQSPHYQYSSQNQDVIFLMKLDVE